MPEHSIKTCLSLANLLLSGTDAVKGKFNDVIDQTVIKIDPVVTIYKPDNQRSGQSVFVVWMIPGWFFHRGNLYILSVRIKRSIKCQG